MRFFGMFKFLKFQISLNLKEYYCGKKSKDEFQNNLEN